MKVRIVFFFLLFSSLIATGFAHGDKKHKKENKKADTVLVVNGDTIAVNGVAITDSSIHLLKEEEHSEEDEEFKLTIEDALFEHIHNKIIHFPIAFIVLGFLFTLFEFKYQKFDLAIKIMIILTVLFSAAAFVTGNIQMEAFEETPKDWLVHLHRIFGIITFSVSVLWTLFLYNNKLKKYAWAIALLAFLIVSVTGFLGGVLAH